MPLLIAILTAKRLSTVTREKSISYSLTFYYFAFTLENEDEPKRKRSHTVRPLL